MGTLVEFRYGLDPKKPYKISFDFRSDLALSPTFEIESIAGNFAIPDTNILANFLYAVGQDLWWRDGVNIFGYTAKIVNNTNLTEIIEVVDVPMGLIITGSASQFGTGVDNQVIGFRGSVPRSGRIRPFAVGLVSAEVTGIVDKSPIAVDVKTQSTINFITALNGSEMAYKTKLLQTGKTTLAPLPQIPLNWYHSTRKS